MRSEFRFLKFFICSLLLTACGERELLKETEGPDYLAGLKTDTSLHDAQRFSIAENEYCKVLYLSGSRAKEDTTAIYVLPKDTSLKIKLPEKGFLIKAPCRRIASLSSVYSYMLCELGSAENIVAIENIDYYHRAEIIQKFKNSELTELAKTPETDVEKTVRLKPDVIFTFGMGNAIKGADEKIIRAGIPMVITVDHYEETPLARAEWIKFFAAFVNKSALADSIFRQTKTRYYKNRQIASTAGKRPAVFTELKFGEIWYMPGGKSYVAALISDAAGDYVWKNDSSTGSLHLSLEEVLVKARDADFWINLGLLHKKEELQSVEPRYAAFKAFKNGQLYNNVKHVNAHGYSDYWESGIVYPDRILNDLTVIFHPELSSQLNSDLFYYKKLE